MTCVITYAGYLLMVDEFTILWCGVKHFEMGKRGDTEGVPTLTLPRSSSCISKKQHSPIM